MKNSLRISYGVLALLALASGASGVVVSPRVDRAPKVPDTTLVSSRWLDSLKNSGASGTGAFLRASAGGSTPRDSISVVLRDSIISIADDSLDSFNRDSLKNALADSMAARSWTISRKWSFSDSLVVEKYLGLLSSFSATPALFSINTKVQLSDDRRDSVIIGGGLWLGEYKKGGTISAVILPTQRRPFIMLQEDSVGAYIGVSNVNVNQVGWLYLAANTYVDSAGTMRVFRGGAAQPRIALRAETGPGSAGLSQIIFYVTAAPSASAVDAAVSVITAATVDSAARWAFYGATADSQISAKSGHFSQGLKVAGAFDVLGKNTTYGSDTTYTRISPDVNGGVHIQAYKPNAGLVDVIRIPVTGNILGYNTFIGNSSGNSTQTGTGNTGVGNSTLYYLTSGSSNTAIGHQALVLHKSGDNNTALGFYAMVNDTTGANNVALGSYTLVANRNSGSHVAIGHGASYSHYKNTLLTTVGFNAGYGDTSHSELVAIGSYSAYSNKSGSRNVFVGPSAGYGTASGDGNTVIGPYAGYGASGSPGVYNYAVVIGYAAGYGMTSAPGTVLVGEWSGRLITSSGYNTMVGSSAGYTTTGANNTFVGYTAGYSNTTGAGNTFLGFQAGYYETGGNKLFIDNAPRASEADGRAKALIYGEFAAATADQQLNLNGDIYVSDSLVVAGITNVAALNASGLMGTSSSRLWLGASTPPAIGLDKYVSFYTSTYNSHGLVSDNYTNSISDDSWLFGAVLFTGTAETNVGGYSFRSVGTDENGANFNLWTMSAGTSYAHRFHADGDVSLGGSGDTAGKDFAVYTGSTWTGFNAGDALLSNSSDPAMKWDIKPVPQETITHLRELFADSLTVSTYKWLTASLLDSTQVANVKVDSLRLVKKGQYAAAKKLRPNILKTANDRAIIPHVGLMATDGIKISRVLNPEEAREGEVNGSHVFSAMIAVLGAQERELRDLRQRIAALEAVQ